MAGEPITWRNVSGPSLTEAFRPMQSAQQSILGGFDTFNNLLQKQETVDRANWQQQKENNLNDFMNQIYAAKGPEGFKALQDSGQLDQMLAGYGAQIDQAAARKTLDTRMGFLQDQALKDVNYNNTMTDEAQAPLLREIQMMSYKDPAKAQALLDQHPELRKGAEAARLVDERGQVVVDRDRATKRFGWEEQKVPLELQGMRLGNDAKAQSIKLGGIQLKDAQLAYDDRAAQRNLETEIAQRAADHSAQREVVGRQQGELAKALSLPLDARGFPDFSQFTKDDLVSFDKAAAFKKVPLAATTMSGDTIRADNLLAELGASGRYSPRLLRANETAIRNTFNTPIGERAAVGNDAFNLQVGRAQERVVNDENDRNSWYGAGSPNALRNYDQLSKDIEGMFGANEKEDLPHVQKYLGEIARSGITFTDKDGKKQTVVPSYNDVMDAVRSTYEGWNFFNTGRRDDIKAHLEKALKTAAVEKMIANGQRSEQFRRRQAVRDELYGSGVQKK